MTDWFDPEAVGRRARRRVPRGEGGTVTLDDVRAELEDAEEGGRRSPYAFRPGQTPEQEPNRFRLPIPGRGTGLYSEHSQPGGRAYPRYYAGDEWTPSRTPPHNVAALQRALVDAGFLEDPSYGRWDRASAHAFEQAMVRANAEGVDVEALLLNYADARAMAEQEAKGPFVPSALELTTTNPKDLERLFRDVSAELLGVGWSAPEVQELVQAYNWHEVQVQRDAQERMIERERQLWETGETDIEEITKVSPMSPQTFAETEARKRDLGGFQATQIAEDYAPAFFEALGGFT